MSLSGLQKQSGDARAFSFLKILELIPHTLQPPLMLFVENVVGFEVVNEFISSMYTLNSDEIIIWLLYLFFLFGYRLLIRMQK